MKFQDVETSSALHCLSDIALSKEKVKLPNNNYRKKKLTKVFSLVSIFSFHDSTTHLWNWTRTGLKTSDDVSEIHILTFQQKNLKKHQTLRIKPMKRSNIHKSQHIFVQITIHDSLLLKHIKFLPTKDHFCALMYISEGILFDLTPEHHVSSPISGMPSSSSDSLFSELSSSLSDCGSGSCTTLSSYV